jgi:hypothetical protein
MRIIDAELRPVDAIEETMHAGIFICCIVFDEQLRRGQLDSRTSAATASIILDPRRPGSGSHDQGNKRQPARRAPDTSVCSIRSGCS